MNQKFNILPIVLTIVTAWSAQAQEVAYSPAMLRALVPEGQKIDLSFLEKGYDLPPGIHRFAVYFNGELLNYSDIEIREHDNEIAPVFRVVDIKSWALKEDILEKLADKSDYDEVFPIKNYMKGASVKIDAGEMKLDISIPQVFLADKDGWVDVVDSKYWDYGENAALINYNFTGNHLKTINTNYESSSLYGNLSGRLNIGAWRLYTSGSFYANKIKANEYNDRSTSWDLWNTYLQRDIPDWKGTLQIGELNTTGEIFESVPIRGFRVATNEQMLPNKDRSYAPVIEGIANTNAQIIIRQNGHVVHTLNVAPGPFRLDNLPSFGDYGDLEVVIRESDGSERIMNVPYSSVPNMLREGQFRYDANVGRFYYKNQPENIKNPYLFMGTIQYGLPNDVTVYGGTLLSEDYSAFALGTGLSLGTYGAVAADVIQSNYQKDYSRAISEDGHGAAWRVRYEKTMMNTGTTVNLANYQYISGRYSSFQDYVEYGTAASNFLFGRGKLKSRWQLSLSQNLYRFGTFSFGGDYAQYSGDASDIKSWHANYSTSIKGVGVSLNYSRNYYQIGQFNNKSWESDHTVMLNINIPLSIFYKYSSSDLVNNTSVSYMGNMRKSASGEKDYSHSVVMNGYSSETDISWTLAQDLGNKEERSTSASFGYSGDRLNVNMGIDHNHYANNYQLGLSGAALLHKTGITFSSNAYDSVALIEVPGAEGVKISNNFDTKTDMFGHSLLTYLSNYTRNELSIDPATLPEGALLLDGSNRVVIPAAGSIVRVKYPVRFGHQAVFVLQDGNAQPLPLGAMVDLLDENGEKDPFVNGIIGTGGRIYLSGLPKSGTLRVNQQDETYLFNFELPDFNKSNDDFVNINTISLTPNR